MIKKTIEEADLRILPIFNEASLRKVLVAVRVFFEINPNFSGWVNIPIMTLGTEKEFAHSDNDKLQRLALDLQCMKALMHEKNRTDAEKKIRSVYKSKRVTASIMFSDISVYVCIKL